MVVEPKVRGFICTTAHPEGCRENVRRQIDYIKAQKKTDKFKKILVVGASAGYGLASRIAGAYLNGAATVGVIFDKPASGGRTATAGWYNTAAFEEFAAADGLYAATVNGDAYSKEIKDETVALIKRDLGQVDLVVYSLASPRRTVADGTVYNSVLKTTGEPYTNKTIDLRTRELSEVTVPSATAAEIEATVKVMGGEDWKDWIDALKSADALSGDAVTVAYSYIGPELTHPMYYSGSIGAAKKHLAATAQAMSAEGVSAYVSVNKALVTQSSAAIPVVPLYISVLYKVMKRAGLHEGCIEQAYRLFADKLKPAVTDGEFIRLDDLEMKPEIQSAVSDIWATLSAENLSDCADIDGYWDDFYKIFGFGLDNVDYSKDVDIEIPVKSLN